MGDTKKLDSIKPNNEPNEPDVNSKSYKEDRAKRFETIKTKIFDECDEILKRLADK